MTAKNPLAGFKFFNEIRPDTLDSIARMGEIMEYKAGDVIFRFDEPAIHLFGVLEGEVDLSVVFKDKVLKTEIEYEEAIQASMVEEDKSIVVDTVLPGPSGPGIRVGVFGRSRTSNRYCPLCAGQSRNGAAGGRAQDNVRRGQCAGLLDYEKDERYYFETP